MLSWDEVVGSPGFADLTEDEKDNARRSYWQHVVAPAIPLDLRTEARKAFDDYSIPTIKSLPKRAYDEVVDLASRGIEAGAGLYNKAVGAGTAAFQGIADQRRNYLSGPSGNFPPMTPDDASQTGDQTPAHAEAAGNLSQGPDWQAPKQGRDIALSAMKGVTGLAQDARELASVATPIGVADRYYTQITGKELNTLGVAKSIDKFLDDVSKSMEQGQSEEAQAARQKLWWDEAKGTFGDAWFDPRSWQIGVVESLPATIATMAPSLLLAKEAYLTTRAAQAAAGASEEVAAAAASKAMARTAYVAGGTLEGSLQGAQTHREIRESVEKLPFETLRQSQAFQKLVSGGMSEAEARQALAEDSATLGFVLAGVGTGIFGGVGDIAIMRVWAEKAGQGAVKAMLRSAAGEAGEEFAQGIASKLGENFAIRQADPSQPLTKGMLNEAFGGAAAGGLMGAGFGAAAHRSSGPDPAADLLSALPPVTASQARTPEEAAALPVSEIIHPNEIINARRPAPTQSQDGVDRTQAMLDALETEGERAPATAFALPGDEDAGVPAEVALGQQSQADQPAPAQGVAPPVPAENVLARDGSRTQSQGAETVAFHPDEGSLGIPRSEMPQIQAEHHGPLVNFLAAQGITQTREEVDPRSLKPTQAEFDPAKVKAMQDADVGERSVLVSADGYVLDGHHQWLAARENGEMLPILRFDAPMSKLMPAALKFPSAKTAEASPARQAAPGAANAGTPVSTQPPTQKNAPQTIVGADGSPFPTQASAAAAAKTRPGYAPAQAADGWVLEATNGSPDAAAGMAAGRSRDGGGNAGGAGSVPAVAADGVAADAGQPAGSGRADASVADVGVNDSPLTETGRRRVAAVEAIIAPARKRLAAPIVVLDSVTDVSRETGMPIDPGMVAMYHNGRIYLRADRIRSGAHVVQKVLHEVFHNGLERMFKHDASSEGFKGYAQTLRAVAGMNKGVVKAASEWQKRYGTQAQKDYVRAGFSEAEARDRVALLSLEEALAELSERTGKISGATKLIAMVQRAVAAISPALAKRMESMTNAEALALVYRAREAAQMPDKSTAVEQKQDSTSEESGSPAPPQASKNVGQATELQKRPRKTKASAAAQEKARAEYFTPGAIVPSYGGRHDRVISYQAPTEPGGNWSVTVESVKKEGGDWVADGRPRTHSTPPRYSLMESDFTDPGERRALSTTGPKAKGEEGRRLTEKWVIDRKDIEASEAHMQAALAAMKQFNVADVTRLKDPARAIERVTEAIVENLLWLHDLMPPDLRARARLWYDGAHRLANEFAAVHDLDSRQVAGIMAVFSPQMDWFKNVSFAERAITILKRHGDETWSRGMTDWMRSWVANADTVDDRAKRQEHLDKALAITPGKTLSQMNASEAAYFIRAFDEAYLPANYRTVTPEGGFGDFVTKKSEDEDAALAWGSYPTIAKAVRIFRASPSAIASVIDTSLGDEHKVRNFYNNIIDPNSTDGHVTVDTHQAAASVFKAIAGGDIEAKAGMGSIGGSNVVTGAQGLYGVFADAVREAAAQRGLPPREMQSIVWEAIRSLFPAEIKRVIKSDVDAVWNLHKAGKLTREEARQRAVAISQKADGSRANALREMPWESTPEGRYVGDGGTSYDHDIAKDPDNRRVYTMEPAKKVADRIRVSLSASTDSIPGLKHFSDLAANGDAGAAQMLRNIAADMLDTLLKGAATVVREDATGLYGGYFEASLGLNVKFDELNRGRVLAALAKFAENFNQEQIHVRSGVPKGTLPLHRFEDGSYATKVFEINLKKALSREQAEAAIAAANMDGATVTDEVARAYFVEDDSPGAANVEDQFAKFIAGTERLAKALGSAGGSFSYSTQRLWAYGVGRGATHGYDAIRSDLRTETKDGPSKTAQRIAEYHAGAPVKGSPAKPVTKAQSAVQHAIQLIFDTLPVNDLGKAVVKKAYTALARELVDQYDKVPVKVEAWTGTGQPYASSREMRADIVNNNHLYYFVTEPGSFGPPGTDFTGHPLLEQSGRSDIGGRPMLYNDLLRAVHDYFAHSMSAVEFGPKGEEAAWRNHMAVTRNPYARWALTSETRAQNSWVNFRQGINEVPIAERGYSEQKAALLPAEFMLTGDARVDAQTQVFIKGLRESDKRGSARPDYEDLIRQAARAPQIRYSREEGAQDQEREPPLPIEVDAKPTPAERAMRADMNDPAIAPPMFSREQEQTPEFREWFGDSKVVDESGRPLVVYHGTLGDFSVFDPAAASVEGNLGAGFYFTNDRADVGRNYATRSGPDITLKVERVADQIHAEEDDILGDEAMAEAERRLRIAHGGATMPVYLAIENPAVIDNGDAGTVLDYAGLEGLVEALHAGVEAFASPFRLERAARVVDTLFEEADAADGELSVGQAWATLMGDSDFFGIENEVGDYVGPTIISQALRAIGFDGIIDRTVSAKFRGMGVAKGTAHYVVFDPTQIKSAIGNSGAFSRTNPDIRYSREEPAPPFYSQMSRVVSDLMGNSEPAAQLLVKVQGWAKSGKFKADELEWSGLTDWLKTQTGRVAKADVQAFLATNGVRVREVVKGGESPFSPQETFDRFRAAVAAVKAEGFLGFDGANDALNAIAERGAEWRAYWGDGVSVGNGAAIDRWLEAKLAVTGEPKFATYQLPGGTNYREMLLTLPQGADAARLEQERDALNATSSRDPRYVDLTNRIKAAQFKSPHWDEPNVLAHIRMNDRTDADGKRVLFIEEVQSDWAQKGRKSGFVRPDGALPPGWTVDKVMNGPFKDIEEWAVFDNRGTQVGLYAPTREEAIKNATSSATLGVPAAPFVENTSAWTALAVKRILTFAAQNGYDKVAFINGEQSAARYDLSKQIDTLHYGRDERGYGIQARKDGSVVIEKDGLSERELEDVVGKEVAKKVVDDAGHTGDEGPHSGTLSGLDLKVGGEGMRGYYDKILPNVVNDIAKKVGGGRLETVAISQADASVSGADVMGRLGIPESEQQDYWRGIDQAERDRLVREHRESLSGQPGLTITSAMREKLAGGMPLFSREPEAGGQSLVQEGIARLKDFVGPNTNGLNPVNRSVNTMLHIAKKDEEFDRAFRANVGYLEDTSRFAVEAQNEAPRILPKLESLRDAFNFGASKADLDKVGAALYAGTLFGNTEQAKAEANDDIMSMWSDEFAKKAYGEASVMQGRVWTDAELQSQFGLNDYQRGLYHEARKALNRSLDEMTVAVAMNRLKSALLLTGDDMAAAKGNPEAARAAVFDRVRAVVVAAEAKRDAATPAQMEKAQKLLDRAHELQETIEQIFAKGDKLKAAGYFPLMRFGRYVLEVFEPGVGGNQIKVKRMHFDLQADRNRAERALRPKLAPDQRIKIYTDSDLDHKLFEGLSADAVQLFARELGVEHDPTLQKWLQSAISEHSAMRRLIHRSGMEGYSTDVRRTLAQFVTSNARFASGLYNGQEMREAVKAIQAGDVRKLATQNLKYILEPQEEMHTLRAIMFLHYLGWNISSALVNATGPLMQTAPFLTQYGSVKDVAKAMSQAFQPVDENSALGKAIARAALEGITQPHSVYALMAEATKVLGGTEIMRRVGHTGTVAFGWVEQMNRMQTFQAAYRLAEKMSRAQLEELGFRDAYALARDAVEQTQVIYSKANRPVWARGKAGSLVFTFKMFQISQVELITRLARGNANQKRAAAWMVGMLLLASGLGGLPFADDLDDLLDTLMHMLGYEWDTKTAKRAIGYKIAGAAATEMALRGFSGIPGMPIDVSQRLGYGNLIPGTSLFKDSTRSPARDIEEIAGPAASMVGRMVKAAHAAGEGDVGKAASLATVATDNAYKGVVEMGLQGAARDAKGNKVIDTTPWQAGLKAIGVQPRELADAGIANSSDIALSTQVKNKESEIVHSIAAARVRGDDKREEKAWAELERWNDRNPEYPIKITSAQILQRMRGIDMPLQDRLFKSAPKEIRGTLQGNRQ